MLRLVADENFNNNIVRGILRRKADVDIVRAQEVSRTAPIGPVIEDILLLIECSLEEEWEGQIIYLPLK